MPVCVREAGTRFYAMHWFKAGERLRLSRAWHPHNWGCDETAKLQVCGAEGSGGQREPACSVGAVPDGNLCSAQALCPPRAAPSTGCPSELRPSRGNSPQTFCVAAAEGHCVCGERRVDTSGRCVSGALRKPAQAAGVRAELAMHEQAASGSGQGVSEGACRVCPCQAPVHMARASALLCLHTSDCRLVCSECKAPSSALFSLQLLHGGSCQRTHNVYGAGAGCSLPRMA